MGNAKVLDSAALVPLLLDRIRFSQLIDLDEFFCFIHVEKTRFKPYSWTVIHTSFPDCEVISIFYIILLIV